MTDLDPRSQAAELLGIAEGELWRAVTKHPQPLSVNLRRSIDRYTDAVTAYLEAVDHHDREAIDRYTDAVTAYLEAVEAVEAVDHHDREATS